MALPVASRVSTDPKSSVGLRRVTRTMAPAARPASTMGFRIMAYMATMGILSRVRDCMGMVALVGALRGACAMAVRGLVHRARHFRMHRVVSEGATTVAARWLPHTNKPHWLVSGWASAASIWD